MLRCCCCCCCRCSSACWNWACACAEENTETRDTNDTDAITHTNTQTVKTIYSIAQHATSYAIRAHWRRLNWTSARAQKAWLNVHTRIVRTRVNYGGVQFECWLGVFHVCAQIHIGHCGLGRLTYKTVRTFVLCVCAVFLSFFVVHLVPTLNASSSSCFCMLERKCT